MTNNDWLNQLTIPEKAQFLTERMKQAYLAGLAEERFDNEFSKIFWNDWLREKHDE